MEVRGRPLHFGVQLQAQRTSWADYAAARAGRRATRLRVGVELRPPPAVLRRRRRPLFRDADDVVGHGLLTKRVRIGALVNGVLYRDPATLAKAAAQVDEMSGGRLDFSLGAAWAEREFKAYGLDFPPLAERYRPFGRGAADREVAVEPAPGHLPRPLLPHRGRPVRAQARPVAPPAHHHRRHGPGVGPGGGQARRPVQHGRLPGEMRRPEAQTRTSSAPRSAGTRPGSSCPSIPRWPWPGPTPRPRPWPCARRPATRSTSRPTGAPG